MTTTLGRYHFLAWTRRGIEASLNVEDSGGQLDARATLGVQVTISANGAKADTQPTTMNVQLYGPGDVIGIDVRQVVRTEPHEFHRQLRAELPLRHRVRRPRFPLAVHAGRAQRKQASALAGPDRSQGRRIHPADPGAQSPAGHPGPEGLDAARSRRTRGTGRIPRWAAIRPSPMRSPASRAR